VRHPVRRDLARRTVPALPPCGIRPGAGRGGADFQALEMGFFREWRRRRVLRRARLDEALWARVASRLSYLRGLSKEEAARLKELVVLFLAEKEMHGAQGFRLTDEVRLSIAVQACLPILNLGLDVYNGWVGEVDSGRPTFIDEYAAEHPAEFFAVMSEAFFTESAVLARDWPELYRQFALFYRQDPAGRSSG